MLDPDFKDKLAAVLVARMPGCGGLVSVERLSGGASQETYRIVARTDDGERLLALRRAAGGVREPPEEGAPNYPDLPTEAQLMRVARGAGVPEPEIFHVLEEADGLGEGFLMQWLDGETLGAHIVRLPELAALRTKLAYECGRIAARIHAIDLQAAGLAQTLEISQPSAFVERMWERYRELSTPQPMIDYAGRWLLDHLPAAGDLKLVHNDFRNGNLMVDAQGVVAVLDWETAHIGDPMRDLGWICTNSWRFGRADLPVGGFGHYEDLFAGYEAESGVKVDPERVRFWEVFGSFWWAVGCLGMAEHYRSGPDSSVERPAIGRRTSECQVDLANLLIPGPAKLVEAEDLRAAAEMPRLDELLISVRDYLRGEVMAETQGRTNFLARVAGNSLDIVLRDLASGPAHRKAEHQRLRTLLGEDADLDALRWRLVEGLRDASIPLHHPGLADHLRNTVVNQLAIDQPKYSGFKMATGSA